jgi:Caspase domain
MKRRNIRGISVRELGRQTGLLPNYEKSWAVVIGITNYKDESLNLRNARKDAEDVGNLLEKSFGFNVEYLLDEQATQEAILSKIRTYFHGKTSKNDRLIFFFAGHGVGQQGKEDDIGYLLPYNAIKNDYGLYVSFTDLLQLNDLVKAKHVFIVLDCCFSGLAAKLRTTSPSPPSEGYSSDYAKAFIERAAFQILTAGTQNDLAWDISSESAINSAFTTAFLKGLKGQAKQSGGLFLTALELASYVREHVMKETKNMQTPYFSSLPGSEQGEFVFEFASPSAESVPRISVSPKPRPFPQILFFILGLAIVLVLLAIVLIFLRPTKEPGIYLKQSVVEGQELTENMLSVIRTESGDLPDDFKEYELFVGSCFFKDLEKGHRLALLEDLTNCP